MNTFYSCWIGASFSTAVTLYNQEEADFKLFFLFFLLLSNPARSKVSDKPTAVTATPPCIAPSHQPPHSMLECF